MQADRWEIGAVLTQAWDLHKRHLSTFSLAALIYLIPFLLGGFVQYFVPRLLRAVFCREQPVPPAAFTHNTMESFCNSWGIDLVVRLLQLGLWLVLAIFVIYFTLGAGRLTLKAVRGEPPQLADLFSGSAWLLPGLVTGLLLCVALAAAGSCFIVPGLLLAACFTFTPLLLVDRGLGPLDALKESWRLTEGERVELIFWILIGALLLLIGLLSCCIGVLLALPMTWIGTALIYQNVLERKLP